MLDRTRTGDGRFAASLAMGTDLTFDLIYRTAFDKQFGVFHPNAIVSKGVMVCPDFTLGYLSGGVER